MSVSNTLEWLRKSAELTQGSESHAFMLAYECLNNALTTVEEDKKYIVRIERELHAAQTRIARLTGVNTPMEVTDSDTTAYVPTPDTDYAHQYWGWKTTDNMVKVSEAKFVEHAPTGHLANGEPYWNYTQHRRRKAGPWVEVTRQNDHGSIELSAPTQDGDTP